MKKLFFAAVEFLIILTTIGALLMSTGCSTKGSETTTTAQAEGFAIYLTKDNLTADKMPPLNQIQIADTPLIAMSDIISYDDLTYRLTLTADISLRITVPDVPTSGRSFVACVNRQPVYWGIIWPAY